MTAPIDTFHQSKEHAMKHAFASPLKLRPLFAACTLALASAATQAAVVDYAGLVDSGPLMGSLFDGSFSYADPAAGVDGPVDLSSFTLNFNTQTYTLASADAPSVAWFVGGAFVGVDYLDQDSFGLAVQLTAGFTDVAEASFSYQPTGAAQGLGGFTRFTTVSAVPEPAPLGLVLSALGMVVALRGLQARRRPGK